MADPRRAGQLATQAFKRVASYGEGPEHAEQLPVRPIHDILPGIEYIQVRLRHKVEYRSLPYGEAFVLASVVTHLKPKAIFEIGTSTGASTAIMAGASAETSVLYTLDLPPDRPELALRGLDEDPPERNPDVIGSCFRGEPIASKITQLYGDSATYDFSLYRGTIDIVFVDGSHSYDYVSSDSRAALEMLSPGGVIVWDDCTREFPGLVRALNELGGAIDISRIAFTRLAIHIKEGNPRLR
jgi:predicted O-methyltransferase YrrM